MEPLGERNGYIPDQTLGISLLDNPVADFDPDRLTAIQARAIEWKVLSNALGLSMAFASLQKFYLPEFSCLPVPYTG
jgi:hypothetical protein